MGARPRNAEMGNSVKFLWLFNGFSLNYMIHGR